MEYELALSVAGRWLYNARLLCPGGLCAGRPAAPCSLEGGVCFLWRVQVVRHEVPFVPGAFVLAGLLSPEECRQIITATETIGYRCAFGPRPLGTGAHLNRDHWVQVRI